MAKRSLWDRKNNFPLSRFSRECRLVMSARAVKSLTNVAVVSLYTEMGGGEYAIYHLLREIDRTRFRPIVIVNQSGALVEKVCALGFECVTLPFRPVMLKQLVRPSVFWRTMKASREVYRFLKAQRIDVVHCSDVLSLVLLAVPALRLRIPVVYSVIFFYEWSRMVAFNALALFLANRIVTNSDTVKHDLLRKTWLLGGKTETIHHGVDTALFRPATDKEPNKLRRELRLTPGVKLVGMVGRFDPSKGHKIFIRAAARVREERADVKFVLVGGLLNAHVVPSLRRYHDEVIACAREVDLDDNIVFLSHRDDMPEVMRSFDVLVCPSVSEGFGLAVLEGLASGVPVVVSSTVGALEVVRGERGVFVAEVADEAAFAQRILEALELADEVITTTSGNVQSVLTELTWREYARRMEEVYGAVV